MVMIARCSALSPERPLDAGVSPEALAALHSPIGLHLGARTPEEQQYQSQQSSLARPGAERPLR